MQNLFRPEAQAAASAGRYGTVLLARPVSHTVLTGLFSAFAVAMLVFLSSFTYTSKARVPGVLLPTKGVIRVTPPQAGRITEQRVREGQSVQAGDVLFVLVSERPNSSNGSAERAISESLQRRRDSLVADQQALAAQATQKADALRRRSEALEVDRDRATRQIELQRRRVELAEASLKRTADLAAQQFVSAVQVQDKQGELLDQQQRLAEFERGRASIAGELAALRDQLLGLQIQARLDRESGARSIGDADRELTENEARRKLLVTAPEAGIVSAITADVGQSVMQSQSLASIVPAGTDLEAQLYAPSSATGLLQPGALVTLRYQAYPYQKFGQILGTVREVSNVAMRPEEASLAGATQLVKSSGEPLYRVRVAIPRQSITVSGRQVALRAGATLDASILLETRRLYEWLLEPLHDIKEQP